jgi:hypothetical protein
MSASENQVTEIKVFGNQYALVVRGLFEYLLVGCAGSNFCNREHIMTGLTQRLDDRSGAAFVSKKIHALGFGGARRIG